MSKYTKGDTFQESEGHLFTSGVSNGSHYNQIEVHRESEDSAESFRDQVMASMNALQGHNPEHLAALLEACRRLIVKSGNACETGLSPGDTFTAGDEEVMAELEDARDDILVAYEKFTNGGA